MDNLRSDLTNDARQFPGGREVHLAPRSKRDEIGALHRAAIELSLAVRDEHGAMSLGTETKDGQEDLVLSAAPGPGGVDVEREHSSQSFANFNPT